jgi:hypothetical protein
MAKMTIKFDNLSAHIDEKIDEAVKDLKHDFIEKMRDEITKLQTYKMQTYKMFPNEDTEYVKRDDVLRIFDKYSAGDEENADSN